MEEPDPRRIIAEAYRMPDLSSGECRSIFLDWVIGLPAGTDVAAAARTLLARHDVDDHPMTPVLRDALTLPRERGRRGGAKGRRGT